MGRRAGAFLVPGLLAVLVAASAHAAGQGEEGVGASLAPLLELAERNNPELHAMGWEVDAAKERVYPAGALPDPVFAVELRDIGVGNPSLNLSPSQVGSTRYQLRQTFPLWGKRGLRESVAGAEAQGAGSRSQALRLELRARVKTAFAQYYAAHQARRINEELGTVLAGLGEIARARYATGLVPQQDAIKAQSERSQLAAELAALEAEQRQAGARLNVAVGRTAEAPLAPPQALPPLPARDADAAALREALVTRNPQLAAAASQLAAASRNEELVAKNRYPDLTLGFAPVQTGTRFNNWELMFEVNIPLQQASRRAQEREAASLRRGAEARRQALANELLGELGQAWAGFEASARQSRILRDALLPQAELTFQSALASYQNGKVDFATLLDAQRQIRRTRLDIVKAEADSRMRLADIERLSGEEPGESR
ncbi:MAG: TolC family protein [Betaproteobacteria bacterium]|nr:TolC family protein [Betaproteobacteria bacterium]